MEPSVARLHSVGATAFAHCTHPRKAAPGNTYSLQLFFILFCMVQCGSVVVLRLQKKCCGTIIVPFNWCQINTCVLIVFAFTDRCVNNNEALVKTWPQK